MAHNEHVTDRLNHVACEFEKQQESMIERIKTKNKKAAANRGS